MDSLLIHQQANDLVQNLGTRNIKKIALHVGMEISETDCFHDLLGLFAFQWQNHMVKADGVWVCRRTLSGALRSELCEKVHRNRGQAHHLA